MFRNQVPQIKLMIVLVGLICGFQNCGPVQFEQMQTDPSTKTEGGITDGRPSSPIDGNPMAPTATPTPGSPEVDPQGEHLCAAFRNGKDEKLSQLMVINDKDVALYKVRSSLRITAADRIQLHDIRGSVFAATQDMGNLTDLRGTLCIAGRASQGLIGTGGSIIKHRGYLEVSNMHIDQISDTRGTLVIRNGSVQSIHNHRGLIRLIDAEVGEMSDVKEGDVIIETGSGSAPAPVPTATPTPSPSPTPPSQPNPVLDPK